jgi:hypothetical protein
MDAVKEFRSLAARIEAWQKPALPLSPRSRAIVVRALRVYADLLCQPQIECSSPSELYCVTELLDDEERQRELLMLCGNATWALAALPAIRLSRPEGQIMIRDRARIIRRDKGG